MKLETWRIHQTKGPLVMAGQTKDPTPVDRYSSSIFIVERGFIFVSEFVYQIIWFKKLEANLFLAVRKQ